MTPLLRMSNIHRRYPGVTALAGVDLTVEAGSVGALVGENGAGKSTLIKILAGAVLPNEGSIELAGQPVSFATPLAARQAGIAVIHQELSLVPSLSAVDNIFLGQERARWGIVQQRDQRRRTEAWFDRLGIRFDPLLPCRQLSIAQQQMVELVKALTQQARVLVLDEPTASLAPAEVDRLLAVLRDLRQQGLAIIYISHRLEEIFALADQVVILRDGQQVAAGPLATFTRQRLIELMVGRPIVDEFPQRTPTIGPVRLDVDRLTRRPKVIEASFQLRRGEILGLAGLVGAGRTELARLLFGADRSESGSIRLDQQILRLRQPRDAIAAGIGLLPEDRKQQGLVLNRSSLENFALPNLARLSRWGVLARRQERTEFQQQATTLHLKVSGPLQRARQLSGGNQQKIVLAKWLARRCEVLIFDEPTRGVDVGAKWEIHLLMQQLADAGKSLILISSDLAEVMGMSDRLLVMREGRIAGTIDRPAVATQAEVLALAALS